MTQHTPPYSNVDDLLANAGWVRRLAQRLVSNDADADDVVQETFAAAVAHPPREGTPLRPWLARVARNFALKIRRSDVRRSAREAAAAGPGTGPDPSESAARAEAFRAVVEAVAALEPDYREVVLRRWFDGLEVREIAARLGIPTETVRTRLKRAHGMLRARLDARYGGDRGAWSLLVLCCGGPEASEAPRGRVAAAVAAACLVALGLWFLPLSRSGGAGGGAALDSEVAAFAPAPGANDGAPDPAGGGGAAPHPPTSPARPARAGARSAPADPQAAPPSAVAVEPDPVAGIPGPGFAVRVVRAEDGAPVSEGTLRIAVTPRNGAEDADPALAAALAAIPRDVALVAGRPVIVGGLPPSAEGTQIEVQAFVPGRPPTVRTSFDLSAGVRGVDEIQVAVDAGRALAVRVVVRGSGEPVEGAWVCALDEAARRGLDPAALRGRSSEASAVTGAHGRASIADVHPQAAELKVVAPGRTPLRCRWDGAAEMTIEVAPEPGGTVIARCLRLDGMPASGDHVSVGPELGIVGEDGTVVIEDVPPGPQSLFLMEQMVGRPPLGQAPSDRVGVWAGERPFLMEPGARIEVGVGFVRGDATVVVEVHDAAGRPARGVRVMLVEPGLRSADTDARGAATFREVPDGPLRFEIVRAEDRASWMWSAAPVAKGEERRVRVDLADAAIHVVVHGGVDGGPAPGADRAPTSVRLDAPGLHPRFALAIDGRATFDDVPAGRYVVSATGEGRVSGGVEVVVPRRAEGESSAPGAVRATVSLVTGAILRFHGSVRDAALLSGADGATDPAAAERVPFVRAGRPAAAGAGGATLWSALDQVVAASVPAGTYRFAVTGRGGERVVVVTLLDGQDQMIFGEGD